jgi:hypothetical protein
MDTTDKAAMSKEQLAKEIADIKAFMPKTYAYIKERQGESMAKRGLRGEPNCFYAIEGGRVKGTPFSVTTAQAEMAALMVQFGVAFMCELMESKEVQHGTH